MNEARERLQTLGWFFYMLAGAVGLLAPFPLAYVLLGSGFLTAPMEGSGQALVETSSVLVAVSAAGIVVGLAIGLGLALAGRFLLRAERRRFCVAMSWVACLLVPVGTLLGYYSLVELHRRETLSLFDRPRTNP